jgi:acetyl esterase/lipase
LSISRRRVLAGAITGVTLLMVPREVLSPARPAAAISASGQEPSGAVPVGAGPVGSGPVVSAPAVAGASAITGSGGYEVVVESLAYSGQTATVYRPQVSTANPVIFFLHGGFWEYGTRHQYDREARIWAERGWVAVCLDYSLGAGYRNQVDDVLAGVAVAGQQAYADVGRQILFGDSAGGHLAALVAAENPGLFRGQILWSPVISPFNAYQDGLQASAARRRLSESALRLAGRDWADADPSRKVTASTPPLWIAGSTREFVDFDRQGQLLADALGARAEVHLVTGERHGKGLQRGPLLRDARTWARDQIT